MFACDSGTAGTISSEFSGYLQSAPGMVLGANNFAGGVAKKSVFLHFKASIG